MVQERAAGLLVIASVVSVLAGCAAAPGAKVIGGSPAALVSAGSGSAVPSREVDDGEVNGLATWYGERHHGRTTASGEAFDMYAMTAAHKTLPFNTVLRVVETETDRSVVVRVNDRGPYREGRIIDLSFAAAEDLDIVDRGVAPVHLEILEWGDGRRHRRGR